MLLPETTTVTTTAMDTGFWGAISDRFFRYLDYSIDDSFGQLATSPHQDAWGSWYPEQTPPNDTVATESNPFVIGNNPQTWGVGLLLLGLGFLAYKAIK
jgi:hypothetical protein